MSASGLHLIGAGGHAKVIVGLCRAASIPVAACLDDDERKHGQLVLGVPVLCPIRDHLAPSLRAVIAIGDNRVRLAKAAALADLELEWATLVHPRAFVDPSATLGPGTVVFAGAVVQPDVTIGAHSIVNTGASVDHDCSLGDGVHVAPGARLGGAVTLEQGVFLGVGVSCIPGRTIGAWTTVGAGGAVVRDLPAGVVAVGVPARPRRRP